MQSPFEQDNIYFDDETHSYFDKVTGARLISPTTLVKRFSNPFDPSGEILKRCAAKKGVAPQELDKEWKQIGKDANDRGHFIHNSFEQYIKTGEIQKDGNEDIIEDFITNVQCDLSGKLYPEVTLSNVSLGIAGRTDLVHLWDDNIVDVLDIKTNARKKIGTFSYGKYMLPPLTNTPDANFFHYQIQLSCYALMLENQGFCPRYLKLLFVNKERKIEIIPLQYKRADVLKMLKHYENSNK